MHDAPSRRLPGLALKGLGEPEQSGEAPSRLFRGWQANPNSIFSDGLFLRRPEAANGCLVLRTAGTVAERHKGASVYCSDVRQGGFTQHVQRASPSALDKYLSWMSPFPPQPPPCYRCIAETAAKNLSMHRIWRKRSLSRIVL